MRSARSDDVVCFGSAGTISTWRSGWTYLLNTREFDSSMPAI
jgi:hypothetical protein